MMPISTKLTLLVLVLPIFPMISVFIAGFYFYRESFDASAFSTAVSSLLSAILVILLVWERLRDSLFKKLEYLHKNFLLRLFSHFRIGNLFYAQDKTKRLRIDLEKYGKFMIFSTYPRGLLSQIDDFLPLHDQFYRRWKEIEKTAKEKLVPILVQTWSRYDFAELIGINLNYRGKMDDVMKCNYEEVKQTILREHPELIPETITYFEKTEKLRGQIADKLEDFLKSNNLRLEEETSYLYR